MVMKHEGSTMLNITREELREDIREITTEIVNKAVKESRDTIITMVGEDIMALRQEMRGDMKKMERRLNKRIDGVDTRLSKIENHFDNA